MEQIAQWFPGHMAKTFRNLNSQVKLVDVVLEMVDARLPYSSRNPEILKYTKHKLHLILMNKADMADYKVNQAWLNYFNQQKLPAFLYNSKQRKDLPKLLNFIYNQAENLLARNEQRGLSKRDLKVMVVGVPNSGKSTFINNLVGRKSNDTGNRPGVTRQSKWIKSDDRLTFLDTPGLLWPKIERLEAQLYLALVASIPENILDRENLAYRGFQHLWQIYPELLAKRYKLELQQEFSLELFDLAVQNQGCLRAKGKLDYERFAKMFLNDLRTGTLGAISLEKPSDYLDNEAE